MSAAQRKSQKTRGQQRETVFLPFLCIAKRVAGHGVNSNVRCRLRSGIPHQAVDMQTPAQIMTIRGNNEPRRQRRRDKNDKKRHGLHFLWQVVPFCA